MSTPDLPMNLGSVMITMWAIIGPSDLAIFSRITSSRPVTPNSTSTAINIAGGIFCHLLMDAFVDYSRGSTSELNLAFQIASDFGGAIVDDNWERE
ncbi:uncharacterized protein BO96DRAFT_351114 [Aspergillus niger CBS 101883]|uniref:Uncharacterized protein n=2 Tax=Aspergillus niger TaxID=5061 RepID=A2QY40_ASPNC|nr:uncharacterized protein BO96DRAFT_351114 [Aspergillus niger CBS 101883]XP_059601718.1 hypothetical protein An11g11220 [Aspergillus niger]PYH51072.1 hypothetical protein BO96DRAFT_351114 [Aspergillus niger CBS 101883]CAK40920.1 hypothetical protein An11g11220 [Aspergillus niger]